MNRSSWRNFSIDRLSHYSQRDSGFRDPAMLIFKNRAQTRRTYFRLPHILRKTKECEISTSFFSAAFSSATAVSKVGFVGWYLGMVKGHPVLTKSVTSSLIYTAADLSSQTIMQQSTEHYDLVRTMRMGGYGLLILGPSLHFWFNFMSRLFPKKDLFSTFKKMALGQSLYGPAMTTIFFSSNAFVQGENGAEIVARLKRDLLPALLSGVMYWPMCDFITFRFFPVHLQPLVSNSFAYLWTIYMTYMASLEKAGSFTPTLVKSASTDS